MGADERIEVLDWLRGFAALSVLWFHFTTKGQLPLPHWLRASGSYGWLGVEVFFVISGFVIPYAMRRGDYRGVRDAPNFIAKRLVRLEPPYLATIAIILLIAYGIRLAPGFRGGPPDISLTRVLLHLGYLNAFVGGDWLSPVFWTLAVEFQFYLSMALLFPALTHPKPAVRWLALGSMGALTFAWPDRALLFPYLSLFALGAVVFQRRSGLLSTPAALGAVAALSAVNAASLGVPAAMIGLASAALIAFYRAPRIRAFAYLGSISYSVYLLHAPIGGRLLGIAATRIPHAIGPQLAALVVAGVVSLGAACLMYVLVESPSQRLSSRVSYNRPRTRGAVKPMAKGSAQPIFQADAPPSQ